MDSVDTRKLLTKGIFSRKLYFSFLKITPFFLYLFFNYRYKSIQLLELHQYPIVHQNHSPFHEGPTGPSIPAKGFFGTLSNAKIYHFFRKYPKGSFDPVEDFAGNPSRGWQESPFLHTENMTKCIPKYNKGCKKGYIFTN